MQTEIKNQQIWVYDIETLASCFTYTAINVDTEEIAQFIIHKDRNQLKSLLKHLNECKQHVGFNNIGFDYPIIHFIMTRNLDWLDFTNEDVIDVIYRMSQYVIEDLNKSKGFPTTTIWEKEWLIDQLDLFKLWHYNNKARMTSLKALEISMNYLNVLDMPINHSEKSITLDQVDQVLEYNLNDVLATYEFYKRSSEKLQLRLGLNKKYGLKSKNYSDSKIGEELMLRLYCKKTGQNYWDVRQLRTNRSKIALNECIFDYIKFASVEFQNLLKLLKSKEIVEIKGSVEESVVFKGFQYDFGTGGIHGCIKPGIYTESADYLIIDADVASLYPNLAIVNRLYPKHLGEVFTQVYEEDIVNRRLIAKKEGDMVMSDGFKLAANSCYG